MFQSSSQTEVARAPGLFAAFAPLRVQGAERGLRAEQLAPGAEAEAVEFLSGRPVHAVNLLGLIADNGLVSPHNRGTFYACRDERGRLEGVALIGHATLFEARTPRALRAFARAAQTRPSLHLVLGESEPVADFWRHYRAEGQPLRLACRELLFRMERGGQAEDFGAAEGLRLATREDLPLVMPAQAEMAVEECGVNPLEVDPAGFRDRCARRISRGRVWVAVNADGLLDFKADVMAETPEAVYLEGVYVRPAARGRGLGRRFMLRLNRELLARSRAVCLLVNERNLEAQSFYRKTGFRLRGLYETIYLHKTHA